MAQHNWGTGSAVLWKQVTSQVKEATSAHAALQCKCSLQLFARGKKTCPLGQIVTFI